MIVDGKETKLVRTTLVKFPEESLEQLLGESLDNSLGKFLQKLLTNLCKKNPNPGFEECLDKVLKESFRKKSIEESSKKTLEELLD